MTKENFVRARVSNTLKENFNKKLKEDGLTESEFLLACIINYLGIKTDPEVKKIKEEIYENIE